MLHRQQWALVILGLAGGLGALSSCKSEPATTAETVSPQNRFPKDFLWGTAIAGFQVEMGCPTIAPGICEDRSADWYQWITDPELIADEKNYLSGDPPSWGPGHYELYAQDFALAKNELRNNSVRLSLEWSRLFPESTENAQDDLEVAALADPEALSYYHDVLDELLALGLTPMVTINHYTLPLWLHDGKDCHKGPLTCENAGWADPERLIPELVKFGRFAATQFGDRVDLWATLNEPTGLIMGAYLMPSETRSNPPAVTDPNLAVEVLFAQARANAALYDVVHEHDTMDADGDGISAGVGIVHVMAEFFPKNAASQQDKQAAQNAAYVNNDVFLNAVLTGKFDTNLDGEADQEHPELAGRLDYIGLNYYFRVPVQALPFSPFPGLKLLNFLPLEFQEDPEGFYPVIMQVAEHGYPIYITENGTSNPELDDKGPRFLVGHLQALLRAIQDGADVRGYYYWTLMDNYEWNHGMHGKPFGLYAVDSLDPQKPRTPRSTAHVYGRICAAGGLPDELIAQFGK